ncbi:glycoside hydrolase family 35 protein [Lapidilactobacillus salsurivasis]
MSKFEIKDQFYLNGRPFKILSGAVHYFRIHPSQWEDTLFNLKALGFNTVETYLPWNLHEPLEGRFDFAGIKDVAKFIEIADQLNLKVILRPSPYICAEWDWGGLPAWLLNKPGLKVRTTDPRFLTAVATYYHELFKRLTPYQVTQGGPVIMMQVENEYGSYGNDHNYPQAIARMMRAEGVDVPLFTADGTWPEALESGALIADDILTVGNFGSAARENLAVLADFQRQHQKNWPLMCMEYWDGWFNRWGEPIIRRDAPGFAQDINELLEVGSLNLYMMRGGTNFGFFNGCSTRTNDLPQITSYDYDAPITEWGAPTAKYNALKTVIHERYPELPQQQPRQRHYKQYPTIFANGEQSLTAALHSGRFTFKNSQETQPMEALGGGYGYAYYETSVKNYGHSEKIKLVQAADRAHILIDNQTLTCQYHETLGDTVEYSGTGAEIQIGILIENLGRVNYGPKLNAPSQHKGIVGGVMINNHFHSGWRQVALDFSAEMLANLDFSTRLSKLNVPNQPCFYHFHFTIEDFSDTFIDCRTWGKGCVIINGFNLGRYWSVGPTNYLYVPAGLLKPDNEIIVFETEGKQIDRVDFSDKPIY